jgi:putative nucleotidyltransferase with HDIG domain
MSNERIGIKLGLALVNLDSLPAMPDIAHKLLALPLDTEAGEAQMIRLIEQDPQLSAKIVGLANAPLMGVGRKINSIHDATMLLGLKRMKSVAIGIATMTEFANQPATKNFDPHDLWLHSITVALVMNTLSRAMPKQIQPDENLIFLAGLLHDIGLMALHHLDSEASDQLHHQLRLQPKRSIAELELELLGTTHGQIGALLVRHWNLPDEIVEVVGLHHSPRIGDVALANPLVRLANIAEKLLPDLGIVEHTSETINENDWRELCIDTARVDELAALVNEVAMQVVQLPDTRDASKAIERRGGAATPATRLPAGKARFSMVLAPMKVMTQWIGSMLR